MSGSSGALLDMTRFLPLRQAQGKLFGGFRGSDPAFLTERAFTGHKANNTSSNDLGLIYMNARYYVGSIGRFASADILVPDQNDPQALNRYAYARNNPLLIVDPSGHCWGFASGLRNTFYATTCNNLDMAVSIMQHPDASVAEKVVAGAYIAVEGAAHTTVAVGSTVVIVETAPAAIPYIEAAIARATTTALAHETTTAVLGDIAVNMRSSMYHPYAPTLYHYHAPTMYHPYAATMYHLLWHMGLTAWEQPHLGNRWHPGAFIRVIPLRPFFLPGSSWRNTTVVSAPIRW